MNVNSINDGNFFTAGFELNVAETIKIFDAQATCDATILIMNHSNRSVYVGPTDKVSDTNGFPVRPVSTLEIKLPQGSSLYATTQGGCKIEILATLW